MLKGYYQRRIKLRSFLVCLAGGICCCLALAGAEPAVTSSPGSQATPAAKGKVVRKVQAGHRVTRRTPAPGDASASEETGRAALEGRRDPFKLPPPPVTGGSGGAIDMAAGPLPPGTRGLVISQLRLGGIVRQDTTHVMLAVVINPANRAYFLRESDVVYNGVVSKITPDSVQFRENYLDPNGRVQTREVVKRLGQAPGERR
jgi:hypothetical protein